MIKVLDFLSDVFKEITVKVGRGKVFIRFEIQVNRKVGRRLGLKNIGSVEESRLTFWGGEDDDITSLFD